MSDGTRSNIPHELRQLLARDSYSLLIKGASGSGKTSLALAILETASVKNQNFLYITTNGSPQQLLASRSWLAKKFPEKDIIKHENILTIGHGMFVDGRLDEQSALYERITNELMDERAPLIIVDSWDAIVDPNDPEAVLTNVKVLQIWRERAGAKVIFTAQEDEKRNFEFLIDGVVTLKQEQVAGRRIREIQLTKLQGIQISRPSYFFTLSGGMFRSFEPCKLDNYTYLTDNGIRNSTSDTSFFPTGYRELDDVLSGGIPTNSIATIQIDPTLDFRIALSFLRKMILIHVKNDWPIILRPSSEIPRDYVTNFAKSISSDSKRNFDLFYTNGQADKSLSDYDQKEMAEKDRLMFARKVMNLKSDFAGRNLLAIVFLDSLVSESEQRKELETYVKLARKQINLLVLITRKRKTSGRGIFPNTETEFEIVNINGTFFLAADSPWSQFYAIVTEGVVDKKSLELKSMV